MIESQVRALFAQIADGEPASSQVDTRLARSRGRARLRWRRACMAGGSVLAAAAVAALAVAVGPIRPSPGPVAAGPAAPRQFSALVPYVAFGWLPAGQSLNQGGISPTVVSITAGSSGDPWWGLDVYARGQCHLTGSGSVLNCHGSTTVPLSRRAPDVAGHRAFWYDTGIVWQYARGGWAAMSIPGGSLSAALHGKQGFAGQALKIARHVRYGVTTRLLFPVRFSGLPGRWQVHDILNYVPYGGLPGADWYMLTTGSSRFHPHVGDLGVWTDAPYITVRPAPRKSACGTMSPGSQVTSETIDGYRVGLKRSYLDGLPLQELCDAHAGGLWLDIQVYGAHPSIDVVTLFRDYTRLLGTNPANWTTSPIG